MPAFPRFHIGDSLPLAPGLVCALPETASRHVQVLRMQPGTQIQLFDGRGQEWLASVTEMGRKVVSVVVGEAVHQNRELPVRVTLAVGMPANDRMDALVEKAAELGVHAIQPLVCERSVLRLEGERASRKVAHWQAVAVAACEQCGRAVVPRVHGVRALPSWLRAHAAEREGDAGTQWHPGVLSLRQAVSLRGWAAGAGDLAARQPGALGSNGPIGAGQASPSALHYVFLSGPEGGLAPAEEVLALEGGWVAVTLGPRVLRADTAPLAALSVIGSLYEG